MELTPVSSGQILTGAFTVTHETYYRTVLGGTTVISWYGRTVKGEKTEPWARYEETIYNYDYPVVGREFHFFPGLHTYQLSGFQAQHVVTGLPSAVSGFIAKLSDTVVWLASNLPPGKRHDLRADVDTYGETTVGCSAYVYALTNLTGFSSKIASVVQTAAASVASQIQAGDLHLYDGYGNRFASGIVPLAPTLELLGRGTGDYEDWLSGILKANDDLGAPYGPTGLLAADYLVGTAATVAQPYNDVYVRQYDSNDYRHGEMLPALALASLHYTGYRQRVLAHAWYLLSGFRSQLSGDCHNSQGASFSQTTLERYGRVCKYGGYVLWDLCKTHYYLQDNELWSGLVSEAQFAFEMAADLFQGGHIYEGASRLVAAFGYLGLTGAWLSGRNALLTYSVDLDGTPREPAGTLWRPAGNYGPPGAMLTCLGMQRNCEWLAEFCQACDRFLSGYGIPYRFYGNDFTNGGELQVLKGLGEAFEYGRIYQ